MTNSIDFLPVSPLDYIRLHPEMYLPSANISIEAKLIWLLTLDCLALGVDDLRITRKAGWCAVSSSSDWLALGNRDDLGIYDLFRNAIAMPEIGCNNVRHEVVISAFSKDLLASINFETTVIHSEGDLAQLAIGEALCAMNGPSRVVAFRTV